ncbi:hypothetical protein [Streptomyces melanogenes]|uniref:hypothetical protein n=1 Tax=Streptomyces melanogenes TaxID=67326 RepID=UPI00379F367C
MTDVRDHQTMSDAPIRECIRTLLRSDLAVEEARQKRISDLEASGHRIVGGGQTGRTEDGQATWEITDWRTGELIQSGCGDLDAYSAVLDRLDPENQWIHIDNLDTDDDPDEELVEVAGVPESLVEALRDWLGLSATSDEDVATVVGWSVDEVARHRERH